MKIYELKGDNLYDDVKFNAHISIKETDPVDVVKQINRIIQRAAKRGIVEIGIYQIEDWGIGDIYFHFGDRKTVMKKINGQKK
jgi:hypothetical protein